MTFAELNAAVGTLTEGLRIHVDLDSIANVNTRPPASSHDEVGFLRLTTWSYSLIFEAGRISFKLLLSVSPLEVGDEPSPIAQHKATLQVVQQLRTWLYHNLGFESDRELSIRRAVSEWFLASCGAMAPTTPDQWERCFHRLCNAVKALVQYCLDVLSTIMRSAGDREHILATWRRRLQRDWDGYKFDGLINDAALRIGVSINAKALRDRHLSEWKNYLESIPEDEDPIPKMERLIDLVVFNHQQAVLPLGAKDLMLEFGLSPGPIIKEAMGYLREGFESGIRDKEALLKYVRERIEAPGSM